MSNWERTEVSLRCQCSVPSGPAWLSQLKEKAKRESMQVERVCTRSTPLGDSLANSIEKISALTPHHDSRKPRNKTHIVEAEDLNTQDMKKTSKRTQEEPGKNVRPEAVLNRSGFPSNWRQLDSSLTYKCRQVIKMDLQYTSHMCHQRGCTRKDNRYTKAIKPTLSHATS